MPVFLAKHSMPSGISDSDAKDSWEKYKVFAHCETEAGDAQAVRDAHEEAEIPLGDVIEVVSME